MDLLTAEIANNKPCEDFKDDIEVNNIYLCFNFTNIGELYTKNIPKQALVNCNVRILSFLLKLVIHLKTLIMKNLKEKVLSNAEMKCIKGGLKWTNDRSVNVEDRRNDPKSMNEILSYRRQLTAREILAGY
ncbi:hypothetical protein [Pedobacter sp. N23S346]|uniref:hypothetical protein n=1 Tax=Pedobacter sp. N23S346 TaxID=3402750 RepID=UPI003ABFE6D3